MNEDDIDDILDEGDDGSDNGDDDDDGLFFPPRCRRGGKAKSNCKGSVTCQFYLIGQ